MRSYIGSGVGTGRRPGHVRGLADDAMFGPEAQGGIVNWDDDRCWKAGQFYFNRDDRRILVPKRLGFGRTLNFAHPVAWVLFAAPIIIAVIAGAPKG